MLYLFGQESDIDLQHCKHIYNTKQLVRTTTTSIVIVCRISGRNVSSCHIILVFVLVVCRHVDLVWDEIDGLNQAELLEE